MEGNSIRKTSRKPLYLTAAFITIFGLFVFGITRPNAYSKAVDQLTIAFTVQEIKAIWETYKSDLHDNEEFLTLLRIKLESMSLPEEEIKECKKWLPPAPISLNLVIVPDLSKRIVDVGNNPDQIRNDSVLLSELWSQFERITRTKINSKDRLLVDVTDNGQAGGLFRTVADNLVFNLSEHKDKSNRIYFENVKERFSENVAKLYALAKENPIGADYWYYFSRNLNKKLLKSTFSDEYRNILVIITDGYLEAQNSERTGVTFYTGSLAQRAQTCSSLKRGASIPDAISNSELGIRDCQDHFPDLEVFILEINERKKRTKEEPFDPGTPCDYDILRYLWSDWLQKLEIKNAKKDFFIQRNDAMELTKGEIKKFMESK